MSINPASLFSVLPTTLRDELLDCYCAIITNYSEHRWEPSELNAGKLCEIVYSIIHGALTNNYPTNASKPPNMYDACRALEKFSEDKNRAGDRSLRIQIPRILPFLYEIRNNRGVGHVGGEVNPNRIDAESVVANAKWIMAELARIFHKMPLNDAQKVVDALVERSNPLIWECDGVKRILDTKMKCGDQVLVFLYSSPNWTPINYLFELAAGVENWATAGGQFWATDSQRIAPTIGAVKDFSVTFLTAVLLSSVVYFSHSTLCSAASSPPFFSRFLPPISR